MNAIIRFLTSRVTQTICALGLTQINHMGHIALCAGRTWQAIAADTGWSQALVFGGLTVGLLTSSLISALIASSSTFAAAV